MSSGFLDEKYAQICSERTLQANREGFFLSFAEEVARIAGEKWVETVFGKLNSDEERIHCVFQDEKIKDFVIEFLSRVQEIYRSKSEDVAKKRMSEAEESVKKGELKKALGFYNQSVIKSQKNGLALFGRAKVLISLNEFHRALSDLQLCQKESSLEKLRGEIFFQTGVCYTNLGEEDKARISLALAEKLLKTQDLHMKIVRKPKNYQNRVKDLPKIAGQAHDKLKNASKKLSVKYSKDLGRYIVANEEIKTGEVLVVEDAYSACLLPEKFGTHCHHCFSRLYSPIGCPDCSSVAFCDVRCRDLSISTYHKTECKFLDLLIGSGMSILSHTALRMVTQYEPKKALAIYTEKQNIDAYSLCTNTDKRSSSDFLQRTLMAAFLLRILQKSGYFTSEDTDRVLPTAEEFKIGELLLFHLQMLQFNAHEIYETLALPEEPLKCTRPSYIGVALYPTVALFNHDCYPAVTRFFIGKTIAIAALRPLLPGEIVAENYGPIFTWRELKHRQITLSGRYWFECKCKACQQDWPTLKSMEKKPISKRIKCPTESCLNFFTLPDLPTRCQICRQEINLEGQVAVLDWCEKQFELGLSFLDSQDTDKAIETICGALDVFHKVSAAPNCSAHLAQEALRLCLASAGNVHFCAPRSPV